MERDEGYPEEYERDMYTGQPRYHEPLEDQQAFFEPEAEQWTAPSDAQMAGQMDENDRLQLKDVRAVQSAVFSVSINKSLNDCAKDRTNAVWSMNPQLLQFMQEVVTDRNRSNATAEERAGNMERVIPLAATIIEVHNAHSVPIGVNIPGFVPRTYTDSGRYLWVLEPNTPPSQVKYKVAEPDNLLTKQMYTDWRMCDLEQLGREIKIDPEDDMAVMRTDGVAFKVLMDAIHDGHFGEDVDMDAIRDAKANGRLQVSRDVAQKVYNSIAVPLQDIQSRFLNMKDFRVHFARGDGRHFDSSHGLVGAPMGGRTNGFLDTEKRYTPKRCGFKVKLDYIVMD